jgi:two-component sensor histidine kinase
LDFTDKIALYGIKKRFNRAGGRRAHLAGLHGATVVLAAFGLEGLLRAVDQPGRETVKIGCILALCAFSVVIIQYSYQQHIENFDSIARIGAMFCLYGSGIAALVAFGHTVGTAVAMDWSYTVAMGGLAGVVAGIPVGSVYVSFGRAKTVGQRRQMQLQSVSNRMSILYRVARHNIRTETNVILGYLDLIESADRSGVSDDHMRVLRKHATRLNSISEHIKRLRSIWQNEGSTVDTPAAELVGKALTPLGAHGDAIDVEPIGDATVRCHPFAHWAIEEAVDNALTHNDDGTTVTVRTADANGRVRLVVEDDGSGIPPLEVESLQRQAESQLVHGQGLGLQVIYWATESAGGSLAIENRERGGARVAMEFPSA